MPLHIFRVHNTMIAAIGDNKALYIEYQYWPNEGSSSITERAIEEDYTVNFIWCNETQPDYTLHYIHSTMKGTFWVNYMKIQNAQKNRIALNVSGEEIEAVEFFPHISEAEGYLNAGGGWDRSSTDYSIGGEASPDCPAAAGSCSVSPASLTFTGLREQVRTEGATILVHDFDHMPGDDSLIIMYSLSKSTTPSEVTTLKVECEVSCLIRGNPSTYDAPIGNCKTVGTNNEPPSSSYTKEYYVAYRIPSQTGTHKEVLYKETVTGGGMHNKILTGFSTQVSRETMVYTYIMKTWNGTEYEFDKRVVGLINVADARLPEGYRQEFVIDGEKYSIDGFDYTQVAGVGIHKF